MPFPANCVASQRPSVKSYPIWVSESNPDVSMPFIHPGSGLPLTPFGTHQKFSLDVVILGVVLVRGLAATAYSTRTALGH